MSDCCRKHVRSLPKISIIVPCFNGVRYISRTISSLLCQQWDNLEIVVIDGGSTDGTLEILETYRSHFTVFLSEADKGQSDAILKGLRYVSGDIWGWLNADDTLAPDALVSIASKWRSIDRSNLGFMYGIANKIDENDLVIKKGAFIPFERSRLKDRFFITQPACFFDTKWTLKIGGPRVDLRYAMDWDFTLRLSKERDVYAIDRHIADLRIHEDTLTENGGYVRSKEIAKVGRKHGGILNKNHLAFCAMDSIESLYRMTRWGLFRRMRRNLSRFFDLIWGQMSYMVHDHTFDDSN
ncbi:MAG: glycosyltransferase [Opitutales bacterium]|nr:glycosyltransferase [Opitutales bacterium]